MNKTETVLIGAAILLIISGSLNLYFAIRSLQLLQLGEIIVIDGDTIKRGGTRYRLLDYDAPEIRGKCQEERQAAKRAKKFLEDVIADSRDVDIVSSNSNDKYGRTLAWLFVDGRDISDVMIGKKFARPYHGGKRESWCATSQR